MYNQITHVFELIRKGSLVKAVTLLAIAGIFFLVMIVLFILAVCISCQEIFMKFDISSVFSCWNKYSAPINAMYLQLKQKLTQTIQRKAVNTS